MANGQSIVENGRVSALFRTLMSIAAALITAAIIGVFVSIGQLKDSISDLKTDVSILKLTIDNDKSDKARMSNVIQRIDDRLSSLERAERRRYSDDNRD